MAIVFTSAGEALVADLFDGSASAPSNYFIAWGTGSAGATKGDTELDNEAAESRVTATFSQPSPDKNRFVAEIVSLSTQTIVEAGLFTASSSGIMPVRGDFAGIALAPNDKIEFTIDIEWT